MDPVSSKASARRCRGTAISREGDLSSAFLFLVAYATTIHKAQGSEYPIVVMPVLMNNYVMLQRNLIYTGITRAKKILVIVGTKKALTYAVKHMTVTKRNTMLKERLQKMLPKVSSPSATDYTVTVPSGDMHLEAEVPLYTDSRLSAPRSLKAPYADLFVRLSRSSFRSRFHLSEKDKDYVRKKGMDVIRSHASDFIAKRLAPAEIPNDGKQTPMRGHPVFIAQHATACCCRGCLSKWHGIPKGHELSASEQEYVVNVLMKWIQMQMEPYAAPH